MKIIYPITIEVDEDGWYVAYAPDFKNATQGKDLDEALYMAEDMISILAVCLQDDGQELPEPSELRNLPQGEKVISTLVRCDLVAYRAKMDDRAVRKNLTIPNWLNVEAEKAQINFSQVLQEALQKKLGLNKPWSPKWHKARKI